MNATLSAFLFFPVALFFGGMAAGIMPAAGQPVKPGFENVAAMVPDTLRALLCEGESIAVGANTYDQPGSYLDTLLSSQGQDSIVLTVVEALPDVQVADAEISICEGDTVQLLAQNAAVYTWTPAAGLSAANVAGPLAFPSQTTTYHVSAVSFSENLIVNGDFEAGNTGFYSDYTYEQGPVMQPGMYFVGNEPEISHPNFVACEDHTTGAGNMFFANGTVFVSLPIVWQQAVSLTPGSDYVFTVWVQNITDSQTFLPEMQFFINGTQLAPVFSPSIVQCEWTEFTATWNSGPSSSALITIINQNLTSPGNDFALDDISLRKICTTEDSVTVQVFPHFFQTVSASVCEGESYQLPGGSMVAAAGVFLDTLTTQHGCDSVVETTLSVLPVAVFSQNITICQGENATVGSSVYTQPGSYLDTLVAANGCDSVVATNLTVNPVPTVNQSLALCDGETLIVGNSVYSQSGSFTDTLQTWLGCDSIVATELTVNPVFSLSQSPTICEGESFAVGASSYTQPGIYVDTLQTSAGCDSVVATSLTVIPSAPIQLDFTICEGESVVIGANEYTQPGTYFDTLSTNAGCDSLITTTIQVNPSPATMQSFTICAGETVTAGGNIYSQTGFYLDTLQSWLGCDSTVATDLTVLPEIVFSQMITRCTGESVMVGSSTYSQSGTYTDVLESWQDCDSTVVTTLTVLPVAQSTVEVAICEGETFQVGPQSYSQAGSYVDTLPGWQGCDSVVTLTLSVTSLDATLAAVPPVCFGENTGSVSGTGVSGGLEPFVFALNQTDFFTTDSTFGNLPAGAYELWIEDAAGCRKAFPAVLDEPLQLVLTLPAAIEIELGDSVQLDPVLNFTPDSVAWTSAGEVNCAGCLRPYVRPQENTSYFLRLEDANGCAAEAQTEVQVRTSFDVFMPNIFSPNGDGLNDRFTVFAGPSVTQVRRLLIFDRWGGSVFDAVNFSPNDPASGWDGRVDGRHAGQGVFTWMVEVEYLDGRRRMVGGEVILLR